MPKLQKKDSASVLDSPHNGPPPRDLLLRVDAGRLRITLALPRDLSGFGDDQSAPRRTLAVVRRRERRRDAVGAPGRHAAHRRHDHSMDKPERTQVVRLHQLHDNLQYDRSYYAWAKKGN